MGLLREREAGQLTGECVALAAGNGDAEARGRVLEWSGEMRELRDSDERRQLAEACGDHKEAARIAQARKGK